MVDDKKSNRDLKNFQDRRSGLDRRWIIAPHEGLERRSGNDRRAASDPEEAPKAQNIAPGEMETFKDLLLANSLQIDAVAQLLIDKGVFSKEEFFEMLKRIQAEYDKKGEPIS
jgi:hypothetical protein